MKQYANKSYTILVVDDDAHILEVVSTRLSLEQCRVLTATEAKSALQILQKETVDLVISDVRMPGMSGWDLLKQIRAMNSEMPIIFITAYGSISDAVGAIKAGAVDYLTKPFKGRELVKKVRDILRTTACKAATGCSEPLDQIICGGKSPVMRELYDRIERVAPSDVNVLILGESGVGKELVAQAIHQRGERKDHPFVVVDCGSTPTGLLESELFGHVRGSFTHAVRDKKGLIEAADRGTLFLDEIGNISMEMQVRLLRFLESRKIRRVGDLEEIPVDCRIISATNLDLPGAVAADQFREDLFYRLRVVTLRVPPLRERKEDIPLLAAKFTGEFCTSQNRAPAELPQDTLEWMVQYPWPGNVRELKNAIEGAMVLCQDQVLTPADIRATGLSQPDRNLGESDEGATMSLEKNERTLIVRALDQTRGVQKDAAELLGISRRALHYKIKKFGIDVSLSQENGRMASAG